MTRNPEWEAVETITAEVLANTKIFASESELFAEVRGDVEHQAANEDKCPELWAKFIPDETQDEEGVLKGKWEYYTTVKAMNDFLAKKTIGVPEEPTEEPTEAPTEAPTEEPTEEPT